ncbi:MAG: response regulator transcription factor [Proteobacteria bacterium]|nr:response regulator transcription factor [Pseudomonadota bacterium]
MNSSEKTIKILVVEDEKHIAEGLQLNLSLQGYEVDVAFDGVAALTKWKEWRPHLIVLDIMLPGIDGLSVLRNIRLEDERIPILILSAKGDSNDRIKGLHYGVDDYLTKPFILEEFLLRVERLLTRVSWSNETAITLPKSKNEESRFYEFGSNIIDFLKSTATCQAGEIELTSQEIKLIKLFISNKGKPLSRRKLLEIGWGYTQNTSTRTIDNFIVRFRKYFEEDPKKPKYFKSKRAIGYVFDPP